LGETIPGHFGTSIYCLSFPSKLFRAWFLGLQTKHTFIPAVSSSAIDWRSSLGQKALRGIEAVRPGDHHNRNLPQATETSNSSTVARQ
jgi:hypothetical protein